MPSSVFPIVYSIFNILVMLLMNRSLIIAKRLFRYGHDIIVVLIEWHLYYLIGNQRNISAGKIVKVH